MTDTSSVSSAPLDLSQLVSKAGGNDLRSMDLLVKQGMAAQDAKEKDPAVQAVRARGEQRMVADERMVDAAYKGIEPIGDRIKPWDAKKELAERTTDPLETFGSLGSIFAVVASAFTHTPAINAMNAMAGAINAVRANDEKAYQTAYDAWKENTKLALDRHEAEYKDFTAAMEKGRADPALLSQELALVSAKYDDKIIASHNALGDYATLESAKSAQDSAARGWAQLRPQLEEDHQKAVLSFGYDREWAASDRGKAFLASPEGQQWQQQNPNKIVPDEVHALNFFHATKTATDAASPYSARGAGGLQQYIQAKVQEKTAGGGVVTADDYKNWTGEFNADTKAPNNPMSQYLKDLEIQQGSPLTAEQRLQAAKKWNAETKAPGKMTPVEMYVNSTKEEAERRGEPWGPDQIAKAVQDFGRDSKGGLSDEGAQFVVDQYLSGDRQAIVGFARNPADKEKLTNLIAQTAKQRGISGPQMGVMGAEFQGLVSGERALGTRTAQLGLAAGELDQFIPQALEASKGFERTNYPAYNRAITAYLNQTGDPKLRAYGASLQAMENAYSQVVARGGVPTDASRAQAHELVSTIDSDEVLHAVTDQMRKETLGASQAPDIVREEFRKGFITGRGESIGGAGSAAPDAHPPLPEGVPADSQWSPSTREFWWKENGEWNHRAP